MANFNSSLNKMNFTEFQKFLVKYQYLIVFAIIIFSALLKFIYVFNLTNFKSYLYSDMGGYWERALGRLAGKGHELDQWIIWPPFYHIVLSYMIKAIDFFKLAL